MVPAGCVQQGVAYAVDTFLARHPHEAEDTHLFYLSEGLEMRGRGARGFAVALSRYRRSRKTWMSVRLSKAGASHRSARLARGIPSERVEGRSRSPLRTTSQ